MSSGIISSSKLTVFFDLRSWKTVRFLEQIMSTDKYPSKFSRQMEKLFILILHSLLVAAVQRAGRWGKVEWSLPPRAPERLPRRPCLSYIFVQNTRATVPPRRSWLQRVQGQVVIYISLPKQEQQQNTFIRTLNAQCGFPFRFPTCSRKVNCFDFQLWK